MTMGIQIVSGFLDLEPLTVWRLLQRSHPDVLTGQRRCLCGETACSLDEVATVIRKQGKPYFTISFEEGKPSDVIYGHIRNYNHSLLSIDSHVLDLTAADTWIAPSLVSPPFVRRGRSILTMHIGRMPTTPCSTRRQAGAMPVSP